MDSGCLAGSGHQHYDDASTLPFPQTTMTMTMITMTTRSFALLHDARTQWQDSIIYNSLSHIDAVTFGAEDV
jgi:hypothetical protein